MTKNNSLRALPLTHDDQDTHAIGAPRIAKVLHMKCIMQLIKLLLSGKLESNAGIHVCRLAYSILRLLMEVGSCSLLVYVFTQPQGESGSCEGGKRSPCTRGRRYAAYHMSLVPISSACSSATRRAENVLKEAYGTPDYRLTSIPHILSLYTILLENTGTGRVDGLGSVPFE